MTMLLNTYFSHFVLFVNLKIYRWNSKSEVACFIAAKMIEKKKIQRNQLQELSVRLYCLNVTQDESCDL